MNTDLSINTFNELGTKLFFDELARQGIEDVFVAPGSRSTPLLLACTQNPKFKIHTHFDERGLGFFALGKAKASQKPTVIITTSGTAVANLLPAVVEAFYSKTPLIVCSADRPFELLNVAANQAIHQKNIFQNFTHDFSDIPPLNSKFHFDSILTLAAHAVIKSELGPVHINWQFQEPLVPNINELSDFTTPEKIKNYFLSSEPFTQIYKSNFDENSIDLSFVGENVSKAKNILLIFGSLISKEQSRYLLKIAQRLQAPVFCDIQNPLRFENFPENIQKFDLLLDVFKFKKPDLILHFGSTLTSKRLNQYLENYCEEPNAQYVQIHPYSERLDPNHLKKTFIQANASSFSKSIENLNFSADKDYLGTLIHVSQKIELFLDEEFKDILNEMSLPYHFSKIKKSNVFIGSSMPIRDFERFAGTSPCSFMFNRGASGIDGNIATASGFGLNSNLKTICVLGDQAFLYDVNSLALIAQSNNPMHTIVINNQGGGIFSFLPAAQIEKNIFNKYFTAPHEWNLKAFADAFHIHYKLITSTDDLLGALESSESTLIEIRSDIHNNVKQHRDLTTRLEKYLNG